VGFDRAFEKIAPKHLVMMTRKLIVIQFLLAFWGSSQAQPQLAQIRGRIVDAVTNRPVSNAVVKIRHVPLHVFSDSVGQFKLNQVPLGMVEFQVTKDGYEPHFTAVEVSPKAYEIDVRLEPKPKSRPSVELQNFEPYQERIYIQTDKPYYYPGEIIWMKANVQYSDPTKRDSLSRALFVELINKNQKVVKSLLLSIDSGRWQASLLLPKDLASGSYALRAYTRFMLNFNDPDRIFTKIIPVLAQNQRVALSMHVTASAGPFALSVQPSTITTRTKVTLRLNPHEPMAGLSASITDATQVRIIPETNLVETRQVPWPDVTEFYPQFIVDKGICFAGTVLSEVGRPRKTSMTIYRENLEEFLDFETDEKGHFIINGLKFYDSATWYYQSKGKKGKASFGTIRIDDWARPPATVVPGFWFRTESSETAQRILPDYLIPLEARMLEEVVINSTRLEDEQKAPGILGGADQVIEVSKLANLGNLLLALQGRVVGLTINCSMGECQVYYNRAQATTISGPIEPMVLINNAPASGRAGQILSQLDLNQVERVEFSRRINVLYGEQGKNGIIAVYLKSGGAITDWDSGIRSFRLSGLHKPLQFFMPQYGEDNSESGGADYRSTIYWNPELTADETGAYVLEFYTSDLPGPYRVTVEGFTQKGQPVRHVSYFDVIDR
jgi:hypothetical protein